MNQSCEPYKLQSTSLNPSLKGLPKFHTINTYCACSILEGKALLLVYFLSDRLAGARLSEVDCIRFLCMNFIL